jgi:hypothetical protein
MASEALFIGIATIAVVIAGFTAVTSGLTPPVGTWDRGQRIRQRAIVSTSFNVMFESLLPPIAFALLDDVRTALVLSSAAVALYILAVIVVRTQQLLSAGGFRSRTAGVLFLLGPTACLLFALNALVFVSDGVYALALCVQLSVAAISFYSLVANASS